MKNSLKQLQILFLASAAGMILMFLVIFYFLQPAEGWMYDFGDVLLGLGVIAVVGGWFLGKELYKRRLPQAVSLSQEEKMDHYRSNVILRLALQEMPVLLALVLFFVLENAAFLIVFIAGVVLFLQSRPSLDEFQRDYMM
ncbi:MAG: hypothetical protein GYB31_20000 [Bacteroidetes bacterium]|nr:hypothetical protein [Bacteroidota bacterium]